MRAPKFPNRAGTKSDTAHFSPRYAQRSRTNVWLKSFCRSIGWGVALHSPFPGACRSSRDHRQGGAADDRRSRRRDALGMAGIHRAQELRDTRRQLPPVPDGGRPLFEGMGRGADAAFHLFHRRRACHPRQLRDQPPRPTRLSWLRAAFDQECCQAVLAGAAPGLEQCPGRGLARSHCTDDGQTQSARDSAASTQGGSCGCGTGAGNVSGCTTGGHRDLRPGRTDLWIRAGAARSCAATAASARASCCSRASIASDSAMARVETASSALI